MIKIDLKPLETVKASSHEVGQASQAKTDFPCSRAPFYYTPKSLDCTLNISALVCLRTKTIIETTRYLPIFQSSGRAVATKAIPKSGFLTEKACN